VIVHCGHDAPALQGVVALGRVRRGRQEPLEEKIRRILLFHLNEAETPEEKQRAKRELEAFAGK
jgi:hypothetical protein